jgi:hypothetical protein
MGWRMGVGEQHWVAFTDWYAGKSRGERTQYAVENPEPEGWEGFYANKDAYIDKRNSN